MEGLKHNKGNVDRIEKTGRRIRTKIYHVESPFRRNGNHKCYQQSRWGTRWYNLYLKITEHAVLNVMGQTRNIHTIELQVDLKTGH